MANSRQNSKYKTVYRGTISKSDRSVKQENINIMIWPAARLVLKRIIKVKGRIN